MHLGVYAVGTGNHISGWRHPGARTSGIDLSAFQEIARTCERGKFDFLFVGDSLSFRIDGHPGQMMRFEPLTLLSALSASTSHIGLVATASTTYDDPFSIARRFSSLDILSGGRAAWNIVTTSMSEAAHNFSLKEPVEHDLRYEMATEFVETVRKLWDSWEDGALVVDTETGQYFDPGKIHEINHSGKYFSVKGPLNVSRTPQGQPVLVQAGSSDAGRALAAKYAEVMFTVQLDRDASAAFYKGMKDQVVSCGRSADSLKILPGFMPIVGKSDAEAQEKLRQLMQYVDDKTAMGIMSLRLGHDMSIYPLDEPVPDLPLSNEVQSFAKVAFETARKQNQTLRDVYNRLAVARGYLMACGSPQTVADVMEEWFSEGAADGFVLMPAHFPESFDDFVDLVVPELQRRGLFRADYAGHTLRSHLGLEIPAT